MQGVLTVASRLAAVNNAEYKKTSKVAGFFLSNGLELSAGS
jgi:hypothetical protein